MVAAVVDMVEEVEVAAAVEVGMVVAGAILVAAVVEAAGMNIFMPVAEAVRGQVQAQCITGSTTLVANIMPAARLADIQALST